MHPFHEIRLAVRTAAESLLPAEARAGGSWFDAVTAEPPRDASHGDMATNAAMALARAAGRKPRDLAEDLAAKLRALPDITAVEIAGPGFINLRFAPVFWQRQIPVILEEGIGYGNSALGEGKKVNVEYVSVNPTGPMHIGHARGAVVGDVLARLLLKAGYDVTREYYINDAGAQIEALARAACLRYREACGETVDVSAIQYPGEYLKTVGDGLYREYGRGLLPLDEAGWMPRVREYAVESMMAMIRADLLDLGIEHDVFFSEKSLHDGGKIPEALETLRGKGLVYRGVLEPPKGKTPEDWEPREQTLFRTSQFGDDCDRPLQKSDGSWTYFAADVAYTQNKLARGFDALVMVLGADHGGYVKRMEAVVQAFGGRREQLTVILSQIVKFLEGGEPVKMSKRRGTFTTVRDVIDAVGRDVVRFIMLTRAPSQPMDFDLLKVTEQSKDNPVFYVQYAHARCHSLMRIAAEETPEALRAFDASCSPSKGGAGAAFHLLSSPEELALIRKLAEWPRVVEAAALAFEPHRIAYYLQETAAQFHHLWNQGNDDAALRFIRKDATELTAARLALARAVATVIASGLHVLGVEPVEEMR